MKSLNNNHLFRLMFVVLGAAFSLGVLPFSARAQTYNLADLIQNNLTIEVGSLTFSNFSLWSAGSSNAVPAADRAGFFVDIVGLGGPQPGLKIRANNQLSVQGSVVVFQATKLSYHVTDANGSIQGSSVLLVPTCVASGSQSLVDVTKNTYIDPEPDPLLSLPVFRHVFPDKVEEQFLAEEDYSSPQESLNIETEILVSARPNGGGYELGQAALCAIEQRFKVAETRADAGPDQVVQDSVTLDGTGSEGNITSYEWKLTPRYGTSPDITVSGKEVTAEGLENNIYDVTLTVTDEGNLIHQDTAIVAASGPCESKAPSLPAANGKLHLWNFKIKKFKFCNWAFARVYGTVDASDLPLEHSKEEDGLKAKVILQVVDKDGNPLGEYSDETAVEIKNRRYKYVIRKKY
ncbi:MAG: hypothetical protein PVJ11_07140 [Syntrophobacterales bacterium]|jgi:hypothetical protein